MRHPIIPTNRRERASVILCVLLAFWAAIVGGIASAKDQTSDKSLTVRFDKNPAKLADITIPLAGKIVSGVKQGLVPLEQGREYAIDGDRLLIRKGYAQELKGRTVLTLSFRGGGSIDLTLLPSDSAKATPGIEFSPAEGRFSGPQHVIVTSLMVDAKIRYTTDGSDPTAHSKDVGYQTVLVDRSMTLKARAFGKGKEPGAVYSASYRIEPASSSSAEPERAADAQPGAGAYEVYVGSAFYMDEMLDGRQWSYVADAADGLYHRFMGVDPLGDDGKKKLGALFRGGKAVVEGGLHGDQHIRQDQEWIADLKAMGLRPVATFVNDLNKSPQQDPTDLSKPWEARIALNRQAGVDSYTMQAPHRIAAEGGWADPRYDRTRRWTLASAGTSADTPTYLFTRRDEAYRKSLYDLIQWTHASERRFMFLLSPNEGSATFLRDAMMTVRLLEDHDARPDIYGVTLYGKRPLHLVPESTLDANGRRVGASTLTGVAYYLLKHARADANELDLWVEAAGGKAIARDQASPDPRKAGVGPIAALAKREPGGRNVIDVVLSNRSHWVDFIPVLKASASGPDAAKVKYLLNGADISATITAGGHLFYRADRLIAGESRKVTVVLPPTPPTRLTFELLPYPGSRFTRDALVIGDPAR